MADRMFRADDAWIEGRVDWDGEIILFVHAGRELRNGRYAEEVTRVSLDVDQATCVRRTLRRLSEESIDKRQQLLDRETQRLEES